MLQENELEFFNKRMTPAKVAKVTGMKTDALVLWFDSLILVT